MNIDCKLQLFFKDKATYYSLFLKSITNIDYILLNLYDYGIDNNNISGDLDILIEPQKYEEIKQILKNQKFIQYVVSNTNQIQWIKYIDKVGIIQIHIHMDIYFNNKKVICFNELYKQNTFLDLNEEYILFLIQTYYKNKFNEKIYKKFCYLQNEIIQQKVDELLKLKYLKFNKICDYTINNIINNFQPSKKQYIFRLFKDDFFNTSVSIAKKIKSKFIKMITFKSNDIEIIFIGVDGAGKSTAINNLKIALNNEVIFKSYYFGLKTSIVNNIRKIISLKNKKQSIITKKQKAKSKKQKILIMKKIYFLIIGTLYWLEYNLKYLFLIRLNSIAPSTIHLIDRSYYDALLYYNIKFLDILFLKYSFNPSIVVYLTGDSQKLYERKKEISLEEINFNKSKYNDLINKVNFHGISTNIINTTENNELKITNMLMKSIFIKLDRKEFLI